MSRIQRSRSTRLLAASVAFAAVAAFAPSSPAGAWAPAASAPIHPGVQTFTAGAQCTANFVFTSGTRVFIGQAAHCSGTGEATDTNGCIAQSLPLGTAVEVTGASKPGKLVYNSWLTMQALGETDADTCAYNDFALVELDPADYGKVNPSIPTFGGPVGINTAGTQAGERVYSYGNSSLRFGAAPLSPKTGTSLGTEGGGWTHVVYTATPGIPGDSGSAFLDKDGKALGILSTVAIAPLAASNNVSDLNKALAYQNAHGTFAAQLVLGTQGFSASAAGLIKL